MTDPLVKPHGLNWNAAGMQLPDMPMVSPGADAMSMTIAGVLPTMAAELTANVAALGVKENMFSGKLTTAESQYNNADDQGGQAVGQLTDMLGKVGDMAKSAAGGGGSGGGGGIFSSLMEQAMKMAEGMGGKGDEEKDPNEQGDNPQDPNAQAGGPQTGGPGAGGQGGAGPTAGQASGGGAAGGGAAGGGAAGQAPSGGSAAQHQASGDRPDTNREVRPPADAAAPGETQRGSGPAPVAPHEPAHRADDDDLKRRL